MFSLAQPPFFARLHKAQNVLIAGAEDMTSPAAVAGLTAAAKVVVSLGFGVDATPLAPSIVNGQIAAALTGQFGDVQFIGDVQFTSRTEGSELFVNPLMGVEDYRDADDERRPRRVLPH